MKSFVKKSVIVIILILLILLFFLLAAGGNNANIQWGASFSQSQSKWLGLDWKENYLALLDDLKVKKLRISAQWDLIEKEDNNYSFEDLDWQVQEAQKRGAKMILAIGRKTPRWPECHQPEWISSLSLENQEQELLEYVLELVNRYKKYQNISAWQIENEPFFRFGICPKITEKTIKKEIEKVKSLDSRPIIITDSGEASSWMKAGRLADILGVTMYRKLWSSDLGMYFKFPLLPGFYSLKAKIVKAIYGKETFIAELQAEPWGQEAVIKLSLKEQEKTMSLKIFQENVSFARKSGLKEAYFWGSEWWYWLKIKHNDDRIWEEAKKLF